MGERVTSADKDLLKRARDCFARGMEADRSNRENDIADRRFAAGEQWTDSERTERGSRPTLTINRLPQFIKQVSGEMRRNRPAIKVLPVDDNADPEVAKVYAAIIRHIEACSDAHRVYAKTGEKAVVGGVGWFRVASDYADDQSFEQELFVREIKNPLAVVCDPDAVEPTRSDANWAIVTEMVDRKQFEKANPKVKLDDFDSPNAGYADWTEGEKIRVAEYWYREPLKRTIVMLTDGSIRDASELKDEATAAELAQLGIAVKVDEATGKPIEREVEGWKVCWVKMTGCAIYDRGEWAGRFIPIIRVVGEEIEVGDRVVRHGLVRNAIDAQRSYNYWRSAAVEHLALQPKAPWLLTLDMIKEPNIRRAWNEANKGNKPYLPYLPDPKAPGVMPQRSAPPSTPVAMYQESEIADADMKATTGIYDASLGARSNETSGKAILAREAQGDTATFVYIDNLLAAIAQCGRVLIDLIPHIYSGERMIRIIGEDDGVEDFKRINTVLPDGRVFNDLTTGRYDVSVTTGPSYATKRMEAADSMMAFIQAAPQQAPFVIDLIAKNMDWPGADKFAERFRRMLPPGVDPEADAEKQKEAGPPQPNPMEDLQVRGATADVEGKEADAQVKKVQAAQVTGQVEQLAQQMAAEMAQPLAMQMLQEFLAANGLTVSAEAVGAPAA